MTDRYVRSLATGTGAGTSYTNAYTSLTTAITASAAGDVFYVADDHAETTASALTLTFKGTDAAPDRIYCTDHTIGTTPTTTNLKTTGTVNTTSTAAMTINGVFYCYGLIFNVGSTTSNGVLTVNSSGVSYTQVYENCSFRQLGSGANNMQVCLSGHRVIWNNCTVQFGNIANVLVNAGGFFEWRNTASAILGATIPTALMWFSAGIGTSTYTGVDFSAVPSGKKILDPASKSIAYYAALVNCKLASGVTVSTTPSESQGRTDVFNADSGSTNYRNESYQYPGTLTTEITIVKTSSAGSSDGTTSFSHKIVTNANCKYYQPFEALPIEIWNETTGSALTVTVFGIWGGGAVPNNDEAWIEVDYFSSSATPISSTVSSSKGTPLATAAAVSTDTSTWGGSTTPFKMSVSITPQKKGPIVIRPKFGKASSTFYLDLKPTVA